MAKKKVQTEEKKFEEILESVDMGKPSVSPASLPEANIAAGKKKTEVESELDSNRALRLGIIEQLEKINNRYYLLIIKKYLDNLK